jgi:hypothetical protein
MPEEALSISVAISHGNVLLAGAQLRSKNRRTLAASRVPIRYFKPRVHERSSELEPDVVASR